MNIVLWLSLLPSRMEELWEASAKCGGFGPLAQCNLNLLTFVLVDFIGWQGGKTGV